MKNIKLVLVMLTLLFSCFELSAQTAAQNFNKGVNYFQAGNYTEAVKWFRKAANQGLARAQSVLGACYEFGDGVKQNYTEAVKWYRKAANQGDANAQYNLGGCYNEGKGVKQNYTEAVKWYRKAANQGFAQAQYNLGVCYREGEGVKQNYTEAVKWFRKAAEQGDAEAQHNLGVCYRKGTGVTKSVSDAKYWYRKAANQGLAEAQYALGVCYDEESNYEEAYYWIKKAKENGVEVDDFYYSILDTMAKANKSQSNSSSSSSSSSSTTYTSKKYTTDKIDIAVEFGGGLGVTEDYDYAIGHNIHLNVFGLYNFNENFLLGLGTGFRGFSVSETYDYINEWDMRGFDISIPIYLRAQYTFADKWSFRRPFVSCDFGWMFPISDEYFSYEKYLIEPHIGIKYDNQITFSLGCTILNAAYPWEYYNESKTICSISAKLGVVF